MSLGEAMSRVAHVNTGDDLSAPPLKCQQVHNFLENEEDGHNIMISSGSYSEGEFEDLDAPPIYETASAAVAPETVQSHPADPGINGKSTEAWVAQFFARSRLHYIGSWQQRFSPLIQLPCARQ
jgi:hypothetical protein